MGLIDEFVKYEKTLTWGAIYNRYAMYSMNDYSNLSKMNSLLEVNIYRNRYKDILPYNNNTVTIKRNNVNYINASYVSDSISKRNYILTMGPLEHTADHFWTMVLEQNCPGIVMLNKIIENNRVKCFSYFPTKDYPFMLFDEAKIQINYISSIVEPNYTISCLKITDLSTSRTKLVLHFHYLTWPDFGVPTSPIAFIEFLSVVRSCGVLQCKVSAGQSLKNVISSNTTTVPLEYDDSSMDVNNDHLRAESCGPTIVHCSAGVGRSGTFCLVDACLVQIEMQNNLNIDVCASLHRLRGHRDYLVQTPKQLRFSYQAIIEGAQRILRPTSKKNKLPSHQIEMLSTCEHIHNLNNSNSSDTAEEYDEEHFARLLETLSCGDFTAPKEEAEEAVEDAVEDEVKPTTSDNELRQRVTATERKSRMKDKLDSMVRKQRQQEQDATTSATRRPYYTAVAVGAVAVTLACYTYHYLR